MSLFAAKVSSNVRAPAAAGRFYPREPDELRRLLSALFANVPVPTGPGPKALIAPHAGYIYSGLIAASAYAHFISAREVIRHIVLIGPSHFVHFDGLAASSAEGFATPLGVLPVDAEALCRLSGLPQVSILDEAHAREHALEVQLPFLQTVLDQFTVLPLVVGEASAEDVSQVIESLWGGPETRFVISSDLSHYSDYETARQLDRATADAIEALKPEILAEDAACGVVPIRGLLRVASGHGLRARAVDLRNSGDTSGPREQVVGYGAFVFEE
ncbi:MAG TPA: AmmeMemoRadiSam system protein B [Candidatus Binatia bacterium]|jgi:AmmeMemoRadiSam system protein B|nr:AmmeMemoRadiSam system protein B [Candidatus Binatia bacterium]